MTRRVTKERGSADPDPTYPINLSNCAQKMDVAALQMSSKGALVLHATKVAAVCAVKLAETLRKMLK